VLNITILSVGTIKEKYLTDALKEYIKRLGAYARVTEVQCKDEHLPDNPSAGEIRAAVEKEGKKILDALPKRAYVCALCIEGKQCSSEQFAARLDALATDGYSDIAFIIGGSDGLSEEVKSRADWKLSFSQMTFPHQLMRVILCEQLYRAMNILGGGKYHK
jgi:23S rRNA (pseudouridine1915-N3)-methyltransferase